MFLARLILVMLFVSPAFAEPFLELGVGKTFSTCDCKYSEDPVGYVAVGYQLPGTGFIVQVDHHSSLSRKDYGQNMVSIRYRYTFGDKNAE